MSTMTVEPGDVRPGDWADHKSGDLDPRPVASVDHAAGTVVLVIGTRHTRPVPITNYDFTREP